MPIRYGYATKEELIEKIDEQRETIKRFKQKLIDIRKVLDRDSKLIMQGNKDVGTK